MSGKRGSSKYEEGMELRRGPWTLEEDNLLIHYIACHGEGRWNLLARCSGLKRTGKSCRLRWLNYLKPDVKRGNLTPEEQILILDLHSKWGNRWSRIAQHLPGRTDNEIKNYWRTRVQKQARQLKIDANSTLFRDAVRCFWMPRLIEKMGSSSLLQSPNYAAAAAAAAPPPVQSELPHMSSPEGLLPTSTTAAAFEDSIYYDPMLQFENRSPSISTDAMAVTPQYTRTCNSSSQMPPTPSDALGDSIYDYSQYLNCHLSGSAAAAYGLNGIDFPPPMTAQGGFDYSNNSASDCSMMENNCIGGGGCNMAESLWSLDELLQVRKLHAEWGI